MPPKRDSLGRRIKGAGKGANATLKGGGKAGPSKEELAALKEAAAAKTAEEAAAAAAKAEAEAEAAAAAKAAEEAKAKAAAEAAKAAAEAKKKEEEGKWLKEFEAKQETFLAEKGKMKKILGMV